MFVAFSVTWKNGTKTVPTREEATAIARSMEGIVLVSEHPVGSVATFRDGRELEGAEATQATLEFTDKGRLD